MNTPGQLDIFDALADVAADEKDRHERVHGLPILFASTACGIEQREAEFDAWTAQWGHHGSICASHAWLPQPTAPTRPTATCQPTVLCADLRCTCHRASTDTACECVGEMLYRGACTGCPWESGDLDDENDAVNAALDHAHPGWLDDLDHAVPPASSEKTSTWENKTRRRVGERPSGWPVITTRTAPGLRSVPGRSPWGGYDVAHCVAETHHRTRIAAHTEIHETGKAQP